jgi:hypothetical protein
MSAKQLGSVACLHFNVAGMLGIVHHIEGKISFELCVIWKFYNVEVVEESCRNFPRWSGKTLV